MTASTEAASTSAPSTYDPVPDLARELGLSTFAVRAVVELLAEGNTVPFIARYRKERTGGLDEVKIRAIEERRTYRLELEERRAAIRASIAEQGKLTDELAAAIKAAETKAALEDLYLPYKPKRKTRASTARERGLEPLALRILSQAPDGDPAAEAEAFVGPKGEAGEVATAADALAGARDIVAEIVAETAPVRALVRKAFGDDGELVSERVPDATTEPTKFEQYYEFREAVRAIPSHRFLAIRRGEAEGALRAHVAPAGGAEAVTAAVENLMKLAPASPWAAPLRDAIGDAYKRLLAPAVENDVRAELKLRSDAGAVDVFADNLKNLLLTAPLGPRAVIGIDPGLRTGCKCAAVDATGKFLASITIFLTQGEAALARAREDLAAFIQQWNPVAIAVGNGTGGREAESFVRKLLTAAAPPATPAPAPAEPAESTPSAEAAAPAEPAEAAAPAPAPAPAQPERWVVSVNEAGASVYSASDVARDEFPDLDLTIRGAISIARRLQDPLAELVKIEPKAIGVGQYQHDVHQPLLAKRLGDVVESCVNHVGVELNTASAELLGYVAGIGKSLAKKIVAHRSAHGAFRSRKQLLDVGGLGPKAFEQCAGFLRIHGGDHPLDGSAVHPERYPLVERMAADLGVEVAAMVGNQALVDTIDLSRYVGDGVGEPTLRDIVGELKKPGRDPRAEFSPPRFRDDVTTLEDLKEGMVLEGVVTNVTAFGAFVDVGVHQDGLVHISRLSDRFVKDAAEVVKVGDKLTVRVLSVDLQRRRIALTARPPERERQGGGRRGDRQGQGQGGPREGRDNRGPRGPRQDRRPDERRGQGQGQGGEAQAQQGQGGGPGGGPRDNRGPRGPRQGDRRRDDRGPRPEGAQAQGQGGAPGGDRGGPRRDDRGPRRDDRGPRAEGDRGGPRRDDRGGPRRDDRGQRAEGDRGGPRRDDRGAPPQKDGIGVSGFKNNPFAKLGDLNKR